MKFEWHFENQDLIRANRSKMENNIFGWVFPSTDTENYIVDIRKEYNCGFDLEVYTKLEGGGHGKWLGSIRAIKSAKSIKRFRSRAEKLLIQFFAEKENIKDNYIYVYKEFCDEDAYNEEIIKIFRSGADAIEYLKRRFEKAYNRYGETFTDIAKAINYFIDKADTFDIREDTAYISIGNDDNATSFWIVEKKEVH